MLRIVLAGPKHSGKTSAGRELASLLGCGFIDLDGIIAGQSGKSPRVLYNEGPEVFRKAETAALAAILKRGEESIATVQVIAAGGGIIDNPGAISVLENDAASVIVFLDVPARTAWKRISRAGELPPFLKTDNPRETHRCLHERRAAAYRRLASFVVKADSKSPHEIAREIAALTSGKTGRIL